MCMLCFTSGDFIMNLFKRRLIKVASEEIHYYVELMIKFYKCLIKYCPINQRVYKTAYDMSDVLYAWMLVGFQ